MICFCEIPFVDKVGLSLPIILFLEIENGHAYALLLACSLVDTR